MATKLAHGIAWSTGFDADDAVPQIYDEVGSATVNHPANQSVRKLAASPLPSAIRRPAQPLGLALSDSDSLSSTKPPAPSLSNVTPAAGLLPSTGSISFDLLISGVANLNISVSYPDGTSEVVYANGAFKTAFSSSTISTISGGKHVVITRTGGWLKSPNLEIDAVDTSGSAL